MRIAIDTGGTFTDCVYVRNARLEVLKLPSTPHNPAEAIAVALQKILSEEDEAPSSGLDLVCGTTVGTNALLERQGGRVALVTTAGFEDVLEIGRQARPRLYDLLPKKVEPLVARSLRFGLARTATVTYQGHRILSPDAGKIQRLDFRATLETWATP